MAFTYLSGAYMRASPAAAAPPRISPQSVTARPRCCTKGILYAVAYVDGRVTRVKRLFSPSKLVIFLVFLLDDGLVLSCYDEGLQIVGALLLEKFVTFAVHVGLCW